MPTAFNPEERVSSPPQVHSSSRKVAAGLIIVAAVTLLKLAAYPHIGGPTPFLLYFGVVMVCAWMAGWRGGLAATGFSALAGAMFFPSSDWSHAQLVPNAVPILVFLIEGAAITGIVHRLHQERERASTAAGESNAALAKLEGVLRGVSDGITLQDSAGQLLYANAGAAKLTGFQSANALMSASVSEILSHFELLTPDGQPFPASELPGRLALRGILAPEKLVRFRVLATGEERWAIVRSTAIKMDGSDVRYSVNVFQDVTEVRMQEEELRLSHERFSTTLKSIGDAVVATDAEGTVTFVNPVAARLMGRTAEEVAGKSLAEVFVIVNENTRQPVESPVDRVIREGKVVGLANHTVLVAGDGSEHCIDDSAAPIRDTNGELRGTVLVFRDVSERRDNERRKAFIAEATSELVSSLDYKQTLATVARLAVPSVADWCAVDMYEDGRLNRLAVAHVDPDKVRLVYEIERRYPEEPNKAEGAYRVARTGEPLFVSEIPEAALVAAARDVEHLRLIRELQLASYIAVPLAANGVTFGVLSLAMAESGRKYNQADFDLAKALADRATLAIHHARLFTAAKRAHEDAERASRTKDEFLAMLGHELRNPLAPIVTALQLMRLRAPEVLERERSIVERQVQHVVRLVDDLLDVSRIASGKVDLVKEPVDLSDTLAKALELAGPLIEERRHEVVSQFAAGLMVSGDPVRLAQVLANLLNNAAKYTPPDGKIEVTGAQRGNEIRIRIRDNGNGIPSDLLPHVFDLFTQGKQDPNRAYGGLGLGLSIVRSVVGLHGGHVTAKSDGLGCGSEFEVSLPALTGPGATPVVAVVKNRETPKPTRARVLVVDDNEDARALLSEALTLIGYEIFAAGDPAAALSLAEQARPDAALLDIGLPVMDGYELGRRLRATPGLEGLKLVAVTGYGQPTDKARARAAGFDDHLVKPISIDAVHRSLESLVGGE